MRPNILSYLPTDENFITTLLRALCALRPVRDTIVRILTQNKFSADDVDFEDLSTQINIGGAIPDFGILRDDLRVLAEIKVSDWRGLTSNQPDAYLQWLLRENAINKFFVFLVPPNYSTEHLQTYRERKDIFCAQNPQNGIIFMEINWLDIASGLEVAGLPATSLYVQDFFDLLQNLYVSTPISFSLDEMREVNMYSKTAFTAISKIFDFVEQIESEIERAGFQVERSFNKRWWEGEYGINIKDRDKYILFLGIWSDYWRDYGYPLCIAVQTGKWDPSIIERFRQTFPNHNLYPSNDPFPWLTSPIDQHFLVGDSVREVAKWLLQGYLNGISALFPETQANG